MQGISQLKSHIKSHRIPHFVEGYLTLLKTEPELIIPKGDDLAALKKSWEDILFGLSIDIDESTLNTLAMLWAELLKVQGGVVTPSFSDELLSALKKKMGEISPLPEGVFWGSQPIPIDLQSEPMISDKYRVRNSFSDEGINKLDEILIAQLKKHVDSQHVTAFIIAYLGLSTKGLMPNLPLSTLEYKIRQSWKDILMSDIGVKPSPLFLAMISKIWFNLIQNFGLPSNLILVQNLLIDIQHNPKLLEVPELRMQKKLKENQGGKGFWSFLKRFK